MSQWSSADVSVRGVKIHYHRTGGDGPPVVLMHGFTDAGLCWTRLATDLQRDYDLVMPDARGHGHSDGPGTDFSPQDRSEDIVGLIRALGLERPALVGHSMGAMMASEIAADHPDLARCAVLEDPPWRDQFPPPPPNRFEQLAQLQNLSREDLIAHCRQTNPAWHDLEVEPWADAKLQFNLSLVAAGPLPGLRQWRPVAERLECPVLLITADPERGAIVTPEVASEAVGLMRDGRVVRLGGAGHNIRRECYEPFRQEVATFLRTSEGN